MNGRRRVRRLGRVWSPLIVLVLVTIPPAAASPPAGWASDYDIASFLDRSPEVARFIAHRIWQNEAAGRVDLLTSWNEDEGHASLGIGHFIWYPAGVEGRYRESFIDLLRFFHRRGLETPAWVTVGSDCPWPDRAAFVDARDDPRMVELRQFLVRTIDHQMAFLVHRMERAIPDVTAAAAPAVRDRVRTQYDRLLRTADGRLSPAGVYALVDYTNFKGEGIEAGERYRGEGWGVLQVLEQMPEAGANPGDAFADAAGAVLTRRVANAPRDERSFLPGWLLRVETYRSAAFEAAFVAFEEGR